MVSTSELIMDKIKILIVIPARRGSKGIPKKNIRLMAGKPLVLYTILNAVYCRERRGNTDIVVTSDDEDVLAIASRNDLEIVERPQALGEDTVALDPVVYQATIEMERQKKIRYDYVITLQPTSPTLKKTTLVDAIDNMLNLKVDTLISVVNEPHLAWVQSENEKNIVRPNYEKRVNRQKLPPYYKETGAFLISRREYIRQDSRIGKKVNVFELSEEEGIDIDSIYDWKLCENVLKSKTIYIRADGAEELGMGHIYRCLSLAYHMTGHKIKFFTKKSFELGARMLLDSNFEVILINENDDFISFVDRARPDIVINDILDTKADYIKKLKKTVLRVVNFEDKGSGAEYADVVINALYEDGGERKGNIFNGFRYFFIRDEFLQEKKSEFREEVRNIVFMFGGSDPSNLTMRCYDMCRTLALKFPMVEFHFITGYGYLYKYEIEDDIKHKIYIHNDVKRVSKYLQKADLAITSQGRTIYEMACMGVPTIVLAQNRRETEHVFASFQNGFINLGIGNTQDTKNISNTIEWLMQTAQVRKEMRDALLTKNFEDGQKSVIDLILNE